MQSLKQLHAHFYQLYEKGTTHAMVDLQDYIVPKISDALMFLPVMVEVILFSCLKLEGNTETIAIHLWEVHYRMAIVYNIAGHSTA